jgi:proton-dependent oligopeptide transporter, POT family
VTATASRFETLRKGFVRTFWVANTLELFERFAFYGSKAVLAVYLAEKVGLGDFGIALAGYYGSAVFFLPALAGIIVDRYGFKKSLAACFSIFSLGYFAVGFAGIGLRGNTAYAIGALLLTAIGGSLIKPCIVGTVARTTTESTKSLGYSIYYTLVNIGGALGPVLGLTVREGWGIEYVLMMSSAMSVVNLIATLLFFREPPGAPEGERRTLSKVTKDMILVFGNLRFISFLVIFSGFWIMFWQIFYSLPFFVRDVLHYPKFELIEIVDACAIIILTVPITAAMKKLRPILSMSSGFAMAAASWLLMFISPTLAFTIAALVVYAVGEAMQAPRFYEYVADLAPKEQVGTFMGFAFLPVAIGALVGGRLAEFLVKTYIKGSTQPGRMWLVVSGIGFGSTLLMLAYDRLIAPRAGAARTNP